MYNHEPPGYHCSLCEPVRGEDNAEPWAKQSDVVHRDDAVTAWLSTRQHNGPEGNQEVWHYHLHVFPRFHRDDLYKEPFRIVPQEARLPYAERLREWFASR